MPDRLLVTGAAGLLGRVVARDARGAFEVFATVHRSPVDAPGVCSVAVDLSDPDAVRRIMREVRPAVVVNAAALARPDACEADPELAERLNAAMPAALAQQCAALGARLVHISTDAVYGDGTGPFREHDPARPGNVYARSKLAGEQRVLAAMPSALVLRTNFFGWSETGTRSLAEFFLTGLRAGREVPGFTDIQFSPLYARDLTELMLRAVQRGIHGVRNLGGARTLSKFEFGRAVAVAFGLDATRIVPTSVADAGLAAARGQLSMDSSRIADELGIDLPEVDAGLQRMRADEASLSRVS